jgi:hypothetical protein
MSLYLISYDIANQDKFEYGPLWVHLEKIGAVKILYSEWLATAEENKAASIYNNIAPLVRLADRLLVQEVGRNSAWDKLLISDDDFKRLLTYARL